jgi:hypothetical protein
MPAASWCVVVVRCWVEQGELRVRMLMSGDLDGAATHSSVEGASAQLVAWLSGLLCPAEDNPTTLRPETPK